MAKKPLGVLLEKIEIAKGDHQYCGHLVSGHGDRPVIIYSAELINASVDTRRTRLLYPTAFSSEAPEVRAEIDNKLKEKYPTADLPDATWQVKEIASILFGLPYRTSAYQHQAA